MGLVWVQVGDACARAAAAAVVLAAAGVGVLGGGSAVAANPGVMVAWGSDADGQLGNGAAGGHLKAGAVPGMTVWSRWTAAASTSSC